jgi:hypothetical protein
MLRWQRPFLEALAEATSETPTARGVRLLHLPHSASDVHTTEGKDMLELRPLTTGWANPLRAFGLPIVFDGTQEIAAVTGQAFRSCSDDEIRDLFRRGMLLDLSALRVLQERGLGHLTGARLVEELTIGDRFYGIEELIDPQFGGGGREYLWWNPSRGRTVGRLEPLSGARPIARLSGPDPGLVLHGMVLYENELGGRVAVSPRDYSGSSLESRGASAFHYVPRRKRMMRPVLRWLGRDRLPLEVEAPGWTLPHRADGPDHILLAVMNVNLDPWLGLSLTAHIGRPVRQIVRLAPNGSWKPLPARAWRQKDSTLTIRLRLCVAPLDIVCLFVS